MDKKSYDNGMDFSFVEQKVREVQTTIENAVKTSNYQELNQSITKMVNNTLKQYQKEHPATVQKKTEHKVMNQKIQETHPELYGNTGGEKVKDILLIVFGGLLSGSMAIGLLTVQILQAVIGHGGITSTAVTLIGTLAGVGMIYGGCTGLGRLKRFKKYVQALGDRTYCDFERLAGAVGRSVKFVKKDIRFMKIHASNDAIPGEEISAKIARMEQIVEQIFQRAEEHPEIIPDLKKMMDYYLPMTVKLLDAYEEMDRQPIQGETIRSSKKEIEDTLDTLNEAFAKLLDSVFQDTAWDVSSDISVLHTMLAQEGLTGNDFSKKQL